jgi:hypothetical protein
MIPSASIFSPAYSTGRGRRSWKLDDRRCEEGAVLLIGKGNTKNFQYGSLMHMDAFTTICLGCLRFSELGAYWLAALDLGWENGPPLPTLGG